ncbi:MAG: hypothetical protein O7G86_00815 [Gammaproteobacteria bacterium]|jgi:uncharacterized membrane protein YkoI|nr:hypothetical protein [Gammaproteobacteria bacterium]
MNASSCSKWLLWLVLVFPLCLPLSAVADEQAQPNYYTKPPGMSLEQAADLVRRETGGRVLSAKPVNKQGRRGYNVRVLLDGKRVKQYYVDAQGRMSAH